MNTTNTLLKSLADAIDIKRATAIASRAANTASRATTATDPAMWTSKRAANFAAHKAQTTLDDVLASVRAHLATQN